MERTRIRDRQAAGIAASLANGKRWGGRTPGTGRKTDPERVRLLRRQGLTIREVASALNISTRTVIRMTKRAAVPSILDEIRTMRAKGKTLQAIADTLSERGVPTKTGMSNRWSHSAIARILRR